MAAAVVRAWVEHVYGLASAILLTGSGERGEDIVSGDLF